jgi:hypothetical protein
MSDATIVLQKWEDKPEAWFLKEKALAGLRRYLEAAEAQKTVLTLKEEMNDPDLDIEKSIRQSITRDFTIMTACRDLKLSPVNNALLAEEEGGEQKSAMEGSESKAKKSPSSLRSKKESPPSKRGRSRSRSRDKKNKKKDDDTKRKRSYSHDRKSSSSSKRKSPIRDATTSSKVVSKVVDSSRRSSLINRGTNDSLAKRGRADSIDHYDSHDSKINNKADDNNNCDQRSQKTAHEKLENEFRIVDTIEELEDGEMDFSTDQQDHLEVRSSRRSPSPGEKPKQGSVYAFANNPDMIKKLANNNNHSCQRRRQESHHESPSRTPPLELLPRRSNSRMGNSNSNHERMRLSSPNNNSSYRSSRASPAHRPPRPRTPSSSRSPPRRDLPVNIYRFNGIRIRNIYPQIHAKLLHELCSRFGKVTDVEVSDKEAVVSFSDCEAPRRAISSWNNTVVHRVSHFNEKLIVRFSLGSSQDKFHMRNVRRVECDECHFYRTTGCPDEHCPEKHVKQNEGIDLQPWMKGGRI